MANIKLAIDLGTANTVVIVQGKGIVIQEPTVVAVSPADKKVVAVGIEAKEMLGKVPQGIEARRPLQQGTIASYRMTEALLKRFITKAVGRIRWFKPDVIISVPAGITSVEQRAVIQALNAAGAGKIYLLPEPIAAALGAAMPIETSSGNMIVNMGGGTSEIAVLSLNGVVSATSERVAGDAITEAITDYLRREHKLIVGEQTAELVKFKIASAIEMENPYTMEVKGRGVISGLPEAIKLNSNQLVAAIRVPLNRVLLAIHRILENTPPELSADIIERGVVLSGGTSLLHNVDTLFTKAIGVPFHVVEEPLTCVVRGLNLALDNVEQYRLNK
jgi:rod shape-determining protein MreB and related proteins